MLTDVTSIEPELSLKHLRFLNSFTAERESGWVTSTIAESRQNFESVTVNVYDPTDKLNAVSVNWPSLHE